MNGSGSSSDSINLLDIIFTAVLTVGLTPEIIGFKGMLSEGWVMGAMAGKSVDLTSQEIVHLIAFATGVSTLLLSWFGIHASLQARPIKYGSTWGMFRFILDVALIFSYGLVLLFFRQLTAVVFLLMLIYGTFVIWDIFKIAEYRDEYFDPRRIQHLRLSVRAPVSSARSLIAYFPRQFVSLWFAICFSVLWIVSSIGVPLAQVSIALLALLFTALYRIGKSHPKICVRATLVINALLLGYAAAHASIPSTGH